MAVGAANRAGFSTSMDPTPVFIVRHFDKMGLDIRSFREPLTRSVREVAIADIKENFRTESYFEHESSRRQWEKLSLARVQRRRSAHPILQDKRRLYRAATALARWEITGVGATVRGNSWPSPTNRYARAMQEGNPDVNLPARPFMVLRGGAADRTQDVFDKWLVERIRRQNWAWKARTNISDIEQQQEFLGSQ